MLTHPRTFWCQTCERCFTKCKIAIQFDIPKCREILATGNITDIHLWAIVVIQFRDRMMPVLLPYLKQEICPSTAILKFIEAKGAVSLEAPLFTHIKAGRQISPSQEYVRNELHTLTTQSGVPADMYGTHSLPRGGSTWMFLAGEPVYVIKQIDDWKSDREYR